ncbi:MAG: RluA family pseudouridine synthase [Cryomorphaceae bacterium]|nr:RluA family pseudouridine synthase [Cryomorphaceae bacterium]
MEQAPEGLYVDGWIGVVVKPAGLMVEPDKLGHPNLQEWAENEWGGQTWAVHRLDRPTSGLIVLARKKTACSRLMQQFEKRLIKKRYVFKTHVALSESEWFWEDYLEKRPAEFRSVVVDQPKGQRASLRGQRSSAHGGEMELFTGRYHQIRAQAAHRGLPILGDTFYGGVPWEERGIALHASHLTFQHPQSQEECVFDHLPYWHALEG